jgi:CheY-like chemotaxis protein/CHASE3 domain sensor protein/putative methionine-R-sulfoxide reductase with GAF domain
MFKLSFQQQLFVGFTLSLLIVLSVNYFSYTSIKALTSNAKLVSHTQEVISSGKEVLTLMLNAETGQRGYLITGEQRYLTPYNTAISSLDKSIDELGRLISDNPSQVARLDSLRIYTYLKLEEMQAIIDVRNTQGYEAARNRILTDRGKLLMGNIRSVTEDMNAEEMRLLKIREESTAANAATTLRNIIIGIVLVLGIILFLFSYITRTFKLQREAEEKVRQSNVKLEELSVENIRQNWLLTGNTRLNEELRGENEVTDLSQKVITALANYLGAKLGSLYLYDEENELLWLTGTYAYPLTDQTLQKIKPGEGLVGQAARERKSIVCRNVPADYIRISSSLGDALPAGIIVAPFFFDQTLKGVIELGFTDELKEDYEELIARVSDNIGIAIQSAEARERMQRLYEQTQMQAEELETQQEELRQTNEELMSQTQLLQVSEEELRVQQEDLREVNVELEEKARLLEEKNIAVEEARVAIDLKAQELELTNKYKSEFLANMSHELRTPLNSILILAKLLGNNKHAHLDVEEVKYAGVIFNAGNDLLTLINDILDLSKIESGKLDMSFEPVTLKEIANDMYYMFNEMATGKEISYKIEIDEELPKAVSTDKMRLEQVIRNLLGNAFKFTASKGSIGLAFKKEGAHALAIAVTDTGVGIAEEKQKLIFDAFQQADGSTSRRYGGTGLGLSISRELASLLGGEIKLHSVPGKGSTFTLVIPFEFAVTNLEIPLQNTQSSSAVTPHMAFALDDDRTLIDENDKTLLIVEDDPSFADILKDYAHKKGFKVVIAADGKAALQSAREFRPDAIILDIMLPVMDGWEVLKELKAEATLKDIPVHVMSAADKNSMKFKTSGAMSFTSKPVKQATLEEIFGQLQYEFNPLHNKVLVIEDQKIQNDNLRRTLEEQGFQVDQAFSGNSGLEQLKLYKYDCVVLDLKLPDMDGIEVLNIIKQDKKYSTLPVIINTAMDITPDMQKEIMKYSNALVIKTNRSNERLLDEVKLFVNKLGKGAPPLPKAAASKSYTFEKALQHKKVLLVDDDMRNTFALSTLLQDCELKVEIAGNGMEALEKLDAHPDFDMVLMDIMMPEMDGYEAMRRIRKHDRYKQVPIIALTAKAMRNDREKCIEAGASDYISKPIDMDKLLSMIRVWLSK